MTWPAEPPRPPLPSAACRRAGFTLIEILVTLAILGFALMLIAGYRQPSSAVLSLRGAASELASGLRLARAQAIARDRSVAVTLDLQARRYRVGAGQPRPLPPNLAIALLTISGEVQNRKRADIRFNPDGSSTGGRISLRDGGRQVSVGVNWLTGRVSIADVR